MKYIVFLNENTKQEEIMVFPKSINHDCFAEGAHFRDQSYGNWERAYREPISAGFIHMGDDGSLHCVGESVSLGIKSRQKIDTALLTEQFAGDLIPLPNIEIPWEATADSVCPVPDGIFGQAQYKCEEGMDEYYNPTMELGRCNSEWSLVGSGSTSIISYKIIDEDYLMGVVTVPQELVDHCKSPVEGMKVDLEQPLPNPEDQLTNKLKFLQNLANQFPEIKDHAVKYMKEWLDYYVEDMINGEPQGPLLHSGVEEHSSKLGGTLRVFLVEQMKSLNQL